MVKMQYSHYDPKPTLFMGKTKIQYPYVKHGTFLVHIDVFVQSIQGKQNFLNSKQNTKKLSEMIKR